MESYALELYPNQGQIYFALFQNVSNVDNLKERLVAQDTTLSCALINAKMVINTFHLLSACNRAISDQFVGKLKTQNIHSELTFAFGTTNNIVKTVNTFGLNVQSTDVIAVKIGGSAEQAEALFKECIKGDLVPFENLLNVRDFQQITKAYGIDNKEQNADRILSLAISAMALRNH